MGVPRRCEKSHCVSVSVRSVAGGMWVAVREVEAIIVLEVVKSKVQKR